MRIRTYQQTRQWKFTFTVNNNVCEQSIYAHTRVVSAIQHGVFIQNSVVSVSECNCVAIHSVVQHLIQSLYKEYIGMHNINLYIA